MTRAEFGPFDFVGLLLIAGAAWSLVKWTLVSLVGRGHLGLKAHVPRTEAPPARDAEEEALLRYTPIPIESHARRPSASRVQVADEAEQLLESALVVSTSSVSESIQITAPFSLLRFRDPPPFERLFSILDGPLPSSPLLPAEPPPPREIPSVSYWALAVEPKFDPPYYAGRLKVLNRFVDHAYQEERSRIADAQARKIELDTRIQARNERIRKLVEEAQEKRSQVVRSNKESWEAEKDRLVATHHADCERRRRRLEMLSTLKSRVESDTADGLVARIELAFKLQRFPPWFFRESMTKLDEQTGMLIHEHRFPNIGTVSWTKQVERNYSREQKPATAKEAKEAVAQLYPALCLRIAAELARQDIHHRAKAIVVNGWVEHNDSATGHLRRSYCASLFADKAQVESLDLSQLVPLDAFHALKGNAAKTSSLTPIAPVLRLDTSDPRFVEPRSVLDRAADGENLASMNWEDFEHLCRELFERAFASSGAEVKVTRASRDQGVDAVIFDPDPLRGGRLIVQAKRYTNTVELSAIRDLYGSVINEGAIKGILVTTSNFGPDAYEFAKGKPISLLNGAELLGLLSQYGYKYRIDIAEARARFRSG